ncbi:MerR family DNA-binding transcriptional regulator [Nocardia sp. CA-107356]
MLIGELADRAGTSARALRYYEQHGLVQAQRLTVTGPPPKCEFTR